MRGKPCKRVGRVERRVRTDRIKGVPPLVDQPTNRPWKEPYGAEHHPDMQKRAIISVPHFSTNTDVGVSDTRALGGALRVLQRRTCVTRASLKGAQSQG